MKYCLKTHQKMYICSIIDGKYMKKKIFTLAMASLLCCAGFSQNEGSVAPQNDRYNLTLEQCIEYAFGNSLERQNMKLTEKVSEYSYEQAKNNRKPQVSGSISESLSHSGRESDVNLGGNIGVNAGVTLYQGGAIKNNIEKSRLEAENAVVRTDQYDHNLIIKILQYFLNALSSEELLRYQKVILETSEEQLRQGEEKYKVGTILESDYLILQAQYTNDECNLLNSQINRDNALLNLKLALSMDPNAELTLVYPDTTDMDALAELPSVETAIQRTLDTYPDMILAKANIDIQRINEEITRAGRRPTVSASAGVSTGHRNFDDFGNQLVDRFSQNIGVSMSVPIYDRGKTKTSLKMNEIQTKMAEVDMQETELKLRQTVAVECANVDLAYRKFKTNEKRAKAYKSVYDAYNMKFKYGTITSVDLLQQQNNYINYLTDYVRSKYSFILERKILDVYMDYPIKYEAVRINNDKK